MIAPERLNDSLASSNPNSSLPWKPRPPQSEIIPSRMIGLLPTMYSKKGALSTMPHEEYPRPRRQVPEYRTSEHRRTPVFTFTEATMGLPTRLGTTTPLNRKV